MKPTFFVLAAFAAALFASPAWPHHSHAMFDATAEIELEGFVKEVRWENPHVWMYIVVPEKGGKSKTWAFEGASVAQLSRKGWTQDSFKQGDKIHISCYPLRSGGPGCLGGYVLTLNGQTMPQTQDKHPGREFD